MNTQRPLTGALALVVLGVGLGLGYNVLHPKPLAWKGEKRQAVKLDPAVGDASVPAGRENPSHRMDPPRDPGMAPVEDADRAHSPPSPPATATGSASDPAIPGPGAEHQITPARSNMAPVEDLYADVPESDFPIEISTSQAKAFYDRGGILVLDAREHAEYAAGHIEGARSAPADEMVGDLEWLDRTAADPRPILVYCDGGDCELSLNLGFEIAQSGHRKVMVYKDGFAAWDDAGYPVSRGEEP